MKSWTHFSVAVETKRLWRVVFDSPPINLVSPEMLTDLPQLIDQMEGASELQAVVFESANPDYFLNHYDTSRVAETPKEAGASGYPLLIDASTRPGGRPLQRRLPGRAGRTVRMGQPRGPRQRARRSGRQPRPTNLLVRQGIDHRGETTGQQVHPPLRGRPEVFL
ncbi:hypothetical protein [Actinacidiphila paucisporea]|uniref:hypothetical protein n=1 Tax=Actinacidiphila paucisporea TaxID=310782 RepID=UPI001F182213|nr:hypothetical protein [Actinacidiphila paucisporea]